MGVPEANGRVERRVVATDCITRRQTRGWLWMAWPRDIPRLTSLAVMKQHALLHPLNTSHDCLLAHIH